MMMLKQVLVATDFSPPSAAAMIYGRALARRFGATLHVLHVAENFFLRPTSAQPHTLMAAKTRTLNETVTDDDRATLHAVATVDVSDSPAEAIAEYARLQNIDLILMGTHGRSGISQFLVGSVAERVVRTAPCPVLTVRHPEHEFVIPDPSETPRPVMITLKQILVATDFSEPSDAALAYGRELARTFDADLTVLHVAENLAARSFGADGIAFTSAELQADVEDMARSRVAALLVGDANLGIRSTGVVVTGNSPAATVTAYAEQQNIDLIVMGTHGRGAVAHLLMGSVAERVVRTAPCPVLTVRHPEHEFVLPDALVAVATV
jgi:nucleotide-binding universal stress UspA family protein